MMSCLLSTFQIKDLEVQLPLCLLSTLSYTINMLCNMT